MILAPERHDITDGPGAIVGVDDGEMSDPQAARSYLSDVGQTALLVEAHTRGDCTHVKASCSPYLVSDTTVLCTDPGPVCGISWEPAEVAEGETVTFRVGIVSEDSAVVDVQWDFGDGGTASGRPVDHEYAASGVYQEGVLTPWVDLARYVDELNARRRVTVVREI